MARNIDLRELVPEDTETPTITLWDGKTFYMPDIGVKQMGQMLMVEETLSADAGLDQLAESNDRIVGLLRTANPDGGPTGDKVPEEGYDWPIDQLFALLSALTGGEGAVAEVQKALTEGLAKDQKTEKAAKAEAAQLGKASGTRAKDDDDAPLASRKRSRKPSSRSGSSGNGRRSGGTKSGGRSSSRTSRTRAANKSG